MPKLLQINVALNWGSTGHIAEQIGQLAESHGLEVHMAHGARYLNDSTLNHTRISSPFEERIHWGISRLFDGQGRGSAFATKRFIRWMDSYAPDIVHIHNIHGYFLNYPVLFEYLRKKNTAVVWTLHDCWPFTGHCTYFNRIGCEKWKTQCRNCPIKHDFPASLIDRSASNYYRKKQLFSSLGSLTIVPVSKWLGNLVRMSFLGTAHTQVIYNGIDTDVLRPVASLVKSRLGISDKYMLLGVATGFGERKGLSDYFKLSSILPESYKIVLVGATSQEISRAPSNIIMLPKTGTMSELAEIYSAADVVLSLSYEETFGLTPIEGMSCGTPSIVYDNTAQPEHITPETGYIVETGNINELKRAIISLCEKGKAAYSEACRHRATKYYDKNRCFEQYIELYNEILANHESRNYYTASNN